MTGLVLASLAAAWGQWTSRPGVRDSRRGANQPPLGVIEEPLDGATAVRAFTVSGWAGDDRGIREIRVLVDGQLAAVASFVQNRPDVTRVYPQFRHGNDRHGWTATVDVGAPGPHIVQVVALDSDGVTSELGVRGISVAR